jgi:hypothetical protein
MPSHENASNSIVDWMREKANGRITEGNHRHEYFAMTQYTFIVVEHVSEASSKSKKKSIEPIRRGFSLNNSRQSRTSRS